MPKVNSVNNTFEERYKTLNKEQKMAVDTIEGPVLVVAGPGTGKTTVLTLRIAQILNKTDMAPHSILAITYTNAGVKAMRSKLKEVIGNTAHDIAIHTFHSFASAMISEYPDHFVKMTNFRQMTDVEAESLVRSIVEDSSFRDLRPLGRPDAYLSSIIRTISDAKKDAMTPDMMREYAISEIKKIEKDEDNISTRGASKGSLKAIALEQIDKLEKTALLSEVYKKYEEAKSKAKLRDYDDLIIELLITLRKDKLFLRLVQERFQYILVDEHQDTNDTQNFIVGLIAEFFETPNVFVVGDEKQAIYRFQGASVENFFRLRKIWPKMKVISLDTNYRSHQHILDASFSMIENNYKTDEYKDLRIKLKSQIDKKKPIDIFEAENNTAQEEKMVKDIKEILEKGSEIVAIITRRNRELERVLGLLESNGIPVSSERTVDIFHHPIGSTFFDLLEYLRDHSRIDALARTIIFGMWGLSYKDAIETLRDLKRGDLDKVTTKLPELSKLGKILASGGAVASIIQIAEKSGFTSLVSERPAFVHVWRGIVTLSESIARDSDIENPQELIKLLLDYRESAESKSVKVSVGAPDLPVKAMTAHGSKGLEFDYVFIPYANDEYWVGRSWGSSFVIPEKNSRNNDVPDIRRLFYVALTRARKHVSVLYAKAESDGKELTELRFLSELDTKSVKVTKLGRVDFVPSKKSTGELFSSGNDDLLTHEAKKVLLENGLSVTALNHFMECPRKFLYESILQLPQAPSVSAEKGTAMHQAFSTIWNSKDRSKKSIEKQIVEVTGEYIDKSLLSVKEKELVKKEINESAEIVARALESHFATKEKVVTERWIETPFDTKYKGEKLTIPIHGKLDAIVDSIDTASVFDYKTRRGMSVSAIKGETKNDDGNYFRQLVFYKMLLSKDSRSRNKKIETSLVFLTPDDYGRCPTINLPVTEADIKIVESEINKLIEAVWGGNIAQNYCEDKDCKYCNYQKLFSK